MFEQLSNIQRIRFMFLPGSHKRRAKSGKSFAQSEPVVDQAWEASNVAYNSTRDHIHRIWSPQERSLSEGQFVRGNRDQPTVVATNDPRAAAGWMSFGAGSAHGRESGVVDAFTGSLLVEHMKLFQL